MKYELQLNTEVYILQNTIWWGEEMAAGEKIKTEGVGKNNKRREKEKRRKEKRKKWEGG